MQTHVQNTEYRDVPVAALIESPSNPRKRFDETSLGELALCAQAHKRRFVSLAVLCPKTATSVSNLVMPSLKGT
jgi:hypothetical protein